MHTTKQFPGCSPNSGGWVPHTYANRAIAPLFHRRNIS